jgi:hypothetical protein
MVDMTEPIPGDPELGGLAPLITTSIPLFKGINALAVVQQKVMNCPLPALLAALAHAMPDRLRSMIQKVPLSTPRTSWFFDNKNQPKSGPTAFTVKEIFRVAFQNAAIEISPILYADHMTRKEVVEAGGTRPRFALSTDGGGWVSYIEKAYVVHRCNHQYLNLDFLGRSAIPLTVARVVEDVARDFDWFRLAQRRLFPDAEPASPDPPPGHEDEETFGSSEDAIQRFRSNKGVIKRLGEIFAAHKTRATIATTHNHTLAIVGYDAKKSTVMLYDALRQPLGIGTTRPMKLGAFLAQHDAVYQVL